MNKSFFLFPLTLIFMVVLSSLSFSDDYKKPYTSNSCSNPDGGSFCGYKSKTGQCFCDGVCKSYGDCCKDYGEVCASEEKCAVEGESCPSPTQGSLKCCQGFSCIPGVPDSNISSNISAGKCKPSCSDSDGGKNETVYGKTTLGAKVYFDSCVLQNNKYILQNDKYDKYVVENYCSTDKDGNPIVEASLIPCKEGYSCGNGYCHMLPPPAPKISKKEVVDWIYQHCDDSVGTINPSLPSPVKQESSQPSPASSPSP